MAVDLSIHIFAYELFNAILVDHGILSSEPPPEALIESVYCGYKGESHANINVIHAVYCRQVIFHNIFRMQFEYTDIDSFVSPSDHLAHMYAAFSSPEFSDLKVFERIFATCAFVIEMILFCFYKKNTYLVPNAYTCWAMYFDIELKSDFYELGGWNVLKSVARSYTSPFLVIRTRIKNELMCSYRSVLHSVNLQKLVAGIEDFYDFKNFSDAGEHLSRGKPWVKYRLTNSSSRKSNRVLFELNTFFGLENFLRCFKFLSDPLGEMVLDLNVSSQNESMFSKRECFASVELADITAKFSDCNINSSPKPNADPANVPKPNVLTKKIPCESESVDGLTDEVQPMEPNIFLTDDVSQDQKGTFTDNNNGGLLKIYNVVQDLMDVDDVETALSHVPVFMLDHYLDKKVIEDKIALDKISEANKYPKIVQIENSQLPVPRNCQNSDCTVKGEKKRTNLVNENVADKSTITCVGHTISTIEYKSDTKEYPEHNKDYPKDKQSEPDTKDIEADTTDFKADTKENTTDFMDELGDIKDVLRMVLVLGCQPGKNYIRSTLKENTNN